MEGISLNLNKKNLEKMSPAEKKAYKKKLAYTLAYTRARAAWHKAIAHGDIDKTVTLQEFRNLKDGKKRSSSKAVAPEHLEGMQTEALADNELIDRLQKMIDDIKGTQARKSALAELLKKLS